MSSKLKKKDKKSKANLIGGLVAALLGIIGGLYLLISLEKISGAEFVVLSLGFAVIGLIITFSAEVQEFSIAGNGVKLKELRSKAEKTIEELKEARTETYRTLLSMVKKFEGGYDIDPFRDKRINEFWKLYRQVAKFKEEVVLKTEIIEVIDNLLSYQYKLLHQQNSNIPFENYQNEIEPNKLLVLGLNSKNTLNKEFIDSEEFKENMILGVEQYRKLFELKNCLISLEVN